MYRASFARRGLRNLVTRPHRGRSTDLRSDEGSPEPFPPGGSATLEIEVEVARAGGSVVRTLRVAPGTLVKELVRSVGEAPEGAAVLLRGQSVPLDMPLERPVHLVVVPTFSGG